jgi:hypothetical protein
LAGCAGGKIGHLLFVTHPVICSVSPWECTTHFGVIVALSAHFFWHRVYISYKVICGALLCVSFRVGFPARRSVRIVRILVTAKPKMYREALALALHRHRPDFEVMLVSAESLDGEIGSFRPHLLLRNDNDGVPPEALESVVCRIEILFSDGMDARVVVDGQVTRIDDMSLDELFGVVDEVETRILGETPG